MHCFSFFSCCILAYKLSQVQDRFLHPLWRFCRFAISRYLAVAPRMPAFPSYRICISFLLVVIVPICAARDLEEIRPWSPHGVGSQWLGKRDHSVFDLKSTETFLWGAEGMTMTITLLTGYLRGLFRWHRCNAW